MYVCMYVNVYVCICVYISGLSMKILRKDVFSKTFFEKTFFQKQRGRFIARPKVFGRHFSWFTLGRMTVMRISK